MAHVNIKGNRHTVLNLNQSDSSWTIVASATFNVTNNSAIYEDPSRSGNTLVNKGHLFADNGSHTITVFLDGTETNVINAATGVINGLTGVRLGGDRQTMLNQGLISTSEEGIAVYGTTSHVTNEGKIVAAGSTIDLIDCDKSIIDNAAGGTIRSTGGTGVSFSTDTGVSVTFENDGVVTSKFDAVSGSNGNDKVINRGTLTGNVSLGDGNNTFDTRGGTFNGTFTAGDGNDTLITDNAKIGFSNTSTDDGTDTVKSTVSYTIGLNVDILHLIGKGNINGTGTARASGQEIYGNDGNNVIKGLGYGSILAGGKGNDTLSGAFLPDTFLFGTGDGHDKIKNFVVNPEYHDHLDVSKWTAIKDFDDLMAHHIEDVHNGALISAGKDSILLVGLHATDLKEVDFVF